MQDGKPPANKTQPKPDTVEAPSWQPAPESEVAAATSHWPLFGFFEHVHDGGGAFTGEAEYMLWFLKGSRSTFSIASSGGNITDLGDTDRGSGPISGGRFTLAYGRTESNPWVGPGGIRALGVEARFFFVCESGADVTADGPPDLSRPFFDLNNRAASSFLVASPGIATGSVDAHGRLSIWGAEANVWKNVWYNNPGTSCAVDLMAGFRYLNANSEFDVNSITVFNSTIAGGSPYASFAGNRLTVTDSFSAQNHFYGGQIGIGVKQWILDCLSFEGSIRLALGATQQDVTIDGSQVRTLASGATVTTPGGLLALPSNSGSRQSCQFTQVPEANFKAVWPVGNQLTLTAGFTALYWNRVARAADQIDRGIDITQIPNFPPAAGTPSTGLARPAVPFRQSDLWLLGISVGLEYRW
jgi:hypothetical protein